MDFIGTPSISSDSSSSSSSSSRVHNVNSYVDRFGSRGYGNSQPEPTPTYPSSSGDGYGGGSSYSNSYQPSTSYSSSSSSSSHSTQALKAGEAIEVYVDGASAGNGQAVSLSSVVDDRMSSSVSFETSRCCEEMSSH